KAYAELESERATSNTLRSAIRDAEHRLVALETDAKAELAAARQQLSAAEVDHRATIAALNDKLAATEQDLLRARQEAQTRSDEIVSIQTRADALEQQSRLAEQAAKDSEARFAAFSRDRDALVEKLEAAR